MISTTAFENALKSLEKAITRSKLDSTDEEVRDATIRRFEYSFELAYKMLKRQLEADSVNPAEIDRLSFKELLREALERSLIDNFDSWLIYRHQRNLTSHTYNLATAIEVYKTALDFYPEALELLNILKAKNSD